MAALSAISKYLVSILLCLVLLSVSGQGVYVRDRSSRQRGTRNERVRERERNQDNEDTSVEERRREPFTRTLVLCEIDQDCSQKFYCHGGEGHKSCLQCRKSHRRCHRDGMCCRGNTCENGRCIPHQFRFDETYNRAAENFESYVDEESISQNTKENFRKRRRGESCSSAGDCEEGLCCAQHLWSKICKPLLEQGDVCTKKRDRLSDIFQRCECSAGLSCKRDPSSERRLHVCQAAKQRGGGGGGGATSVETQSNVDARPDPEPEVESTQLERILTVPAEKTRVMPSKNGDLIGYLSAESGEKFQEIALASVRDRRLWPGAIPIAKTKGSRSAASSKETTESSRTQQSDMDGRQLTVL